MINNQGSFGNQYNNVDEQLFSDYNRPRDHEGFKVKKRGGINEFESKQEEGGGGGGGGGGDEDKHKIKTMRLNAEFGYIYANSESNQIPNGTYTLSGDGGFAQMSGNRLMFTEKGHYLFTIRLLYYEYGASNSGQLVVNLTHGDNYLATGELFNGSIIYGTILAKAVGRHPMGTFTGYGYMNEGENAVVSFTAPVWDGVTGNVPASNIDWLKYEMDIIKIG